MFEIHYRSCFLISLSSDLLHNRGVVDLLQLVDCRAAAGGATGAADDAVEEGDHSDDQTEQYTADIVCQPKGNDSRLKIILD